MLDEIVILLSDAGITAAYPVLVLMVLRPFGMLFSFLAFVWALRGAMTMRIAVAIALALPTLAAHTTEFERLIQLTSTLQFLPIALKEFAIGYALGLLASMPFFALQYAGAVTDTFRGENDTGNQDPTGGTLHTFSTAYLVVGFFAFFSLGGFEKLIQSLYATYGIWPLNSGFPVLDLSAAMRAVDILTRTLFTAFSMALPLLAMLVVIELSVAIAGRLGRRFNVYDLAFPLKNLATVLTMPLIMWLIWQMSHARADETVEAFPILQGFFR
ncbi:EscT/YscT/HrcT family type III secretion system export apparatus protein [uncultured Tateyamaria sp.]|uniref:EscT/YscT/HrcT family type III secretion system export apparatus protein n=1 Tax=uncultured Tateyamaria sp. TaxID=455651 RepID=UPI00262B603E|nr:flagellar biosynthetic protein FliR [uncultured Tateyamaria sp.]